MKTRCSNQKNRAMTHTEVVVIVLIVAIFSLIVVPNYNNTHRRRSRIGCSNNILQISLAYNIWAGDNNDKLPMEVSVNRGGTMELMGTDEAWRAFQVMSNELATPMVLNCPDDSKRSWSTNQTFDDSVRTYVSYFIGLDANLNAPSTLLSGDGNFSSNGEPANAGHVNLTLGTPISWDNTCHRDHGFWVGNYEFNIPKNGSGNIGLADGSVQSLTSSMLTKTLHQTGLATNRIFIP
jgi:competence protein ComGC